MDLLGNLGRYMSPWNSLRVFTFFWRDNAYVISDSKKPVPKTRSKLLF